MKKLVYLFLFLASNLHGQSLYELMSEEGLKFGGWIQDDTFISGPFSFQYCGEDTWCDLPVLKYYSNDNSRSSYPEEDFLRVYIENKKVYLLRYDCEKLLLQDYSLSQGDTINEGFFEGFHIDTIYPVQLLDGTYRARYDITNNQDKYSWIFGLGNITSGFYPSLNPFYGTTFICATRNGEVLWNNANFYYTCEETWCYDARPDFEILKTDSTINIYNNSVCMQDYEYLWDLGDGTTKSTIEPDHTYEEFGCYEVSLGAYDIECLSDTTYKNKLVNFCTNNAWKKSDQLDMTNPTILRVDETLQFAYGPDKIQKSIDNGKTWIKIKVPQYILEHPIRKIIEMDFFDRERGVMVCTNLFDPDQKQASIYYTEDGGITWISSYDSFRSPTQITLGKNGNAWTEISSNNVLKSSDYGKSWKTIETSVSGSFIDYVYVNDTLLLYYARSTDSSIIGRSRDLGETWVFENNNLPISDLYFFNPTDGYLLSSNDEVFQTLDGGITWNKIDLPFAISEITFYDIDHAWFTTPLGAVYYTNDGFHNYQVTHCSSESKLEHIVAYRDTSAIGVIRNRMPLNPPVTRYEKVEFSLSKIGVGNCEEEEEEVVILSSTQDKLSKNQITLFPNPASEYIKIETSHKSIEVQIFNINGHLISTRNDQNKLDISHLANGTYFLIVLDDKGHQIHQDKFVVLR